MDSLAQSWYYCTVRFVKSNSFFRKSLWPAHLLHILIPPNFLLIFSFVDPHLCDALKVEVQITGASQIQDTYALMQLHSIISLLIGFKIMHLTLKSQTWPKTNDALLIQVDLGLTLMCTFVPKQLTRD